MNKTDFARSLADQVDLTQVKSTEILDALFGEDGILPSSLAEGEKISIAGFGTFETTESPARTMKAFGKTVEVEAKRNVKFKPSKTLRERVQDVEPTTEA